MDASLIIPAFIAGILTFLAPCTLPLVPAYLGFISGVSLDDLKDPRKARNVRWKIFINGIFFVAGFGLVFTVMGTLVGLIGEVFGPYRLWLSRIGGIFIIIFGLFMLRVVKIPYLSVEKRIRVPRVFKQGRPVNSLILGSAFGIGWTPCVGPILGAVLTLAAATSTALSGAFLLAVFSLGLAIPFLLVAVGIGSAAHYTGKVAKYLNVISLIGGVFLLLLGALLLTGNIGFLVSYGFRILNFIGYDRLLDYL